MRWLVEIGPLARLVLALCAKLSHIGLRLPSVSWAGAEPLQVFAAIRAYPDMFTATLACLLLPLPLLILLPRMPQATVALMLNLLLISVAVADLIHVRFYADGTSVSALAQTPMLTWGMDSVVTLLEPIDVLHFADVPVWLIALVPYRRWVRRYPPYNVAGRMRLGLAPMLVARACPHAGIGVVGVANGALRLGRYARPARVFDGAA